MVTPPSRRSKDEPRPAPRYLFVGPLRSDYIITPAGQVLLNQAGGGALYAAIGARLWTQEGIGIVTRVGEDYPQEWLQRLAAAGISTSGVRTLAGRQSTPSFWGYRTWDEAVDREPRVHFSRVGRPLPAELWDYHAPGDGEEDRTAFATLAVRPDDLPPSFLGSQLVHFAPCHWLTQFTLPPFLRQHGASQITLDPSSRFMTPSFRRELPGLLRGLSAFLCAERKARALFRERPTDTPAMAEALSAMGCPLIVIKRGEKGQWLYIAEERRHLELPPCNARVRDTTGAGDAFCGGFLVGWEETYDPVEAALRGSVSASLAVEGSGAWFALSCATGLAAARLAHLRQEVRRA